MILAGTYNQTVIVLRLIAGVLAGWLLNVLADSWPKRRWGAAARGTPQPLRRVFVLLAAGGAALGLHQAGQPLAVQLLHSALLFSLLLAGVIDWEQRLLPNPLLLLAAGIALLLAGVRIASVAAALLGAAVAGGCMLAAYAGGRWYAGAGAPPALGFGDVKLAAVLGLALGVQAVLPALLAGVLLAGAAALLLRVGRGYQPGGFMPYAPWLLLGALPFLLR